jgi:hypothetical protein
VVSVPTTTYTALFELGAATGQGVVTAANTKYFRITNLDDTNYVNLKIADLATATNSFVVRLDAGKSFIMGGVSFVADASDLGAAPTYETTMQVEAVATTDIVDLEVMVASI